MEKTSTTFFDPNVGEVVIKSEIIGSHSNVTALETLTGKETKCYFNGTLRFADNNQSVSLINYRGFVKKSIARNIFRFMQEQNGLNVQFN
jgi:hypothetical protein